MVHWAHRSLRASLFFVAGWCGAFLLAGCATTTPATPTSPTLPGFSDRLDALLPTSALLLGERHDAPEHQRIHRDLIAALAERGVLAGVAIEMAEQGHSTESLDRSASEGQVRTALQWRDSEWPWAHYGPAVMAAVRAGAPVYGANLTRPQLRAAMADSSLDALLNEAAWAEQQQRIRTGHCDMLPQSQITPMTRIQIARDRAMAHTLENALRPGKTAVLLAGSAHVDRQLGVPQHLRKDISVQTVLLLAQTQDAPSPLNAGFAQVWHTAPQPPQDYCALFKSQSESMQSRP